jgi:uncharacterized protein
VSGAVSASALFVYPVKSARGIALASARITASGFAWDRQWMIVDEAGHFLTQRTHPHLARIVTHVEGEILTLSAPELPDLVVGPDAGAEPLTVTVWDDVCTARAQGSAADAWLTRALGQPVRLVRVTPDMGRVANARFAGSTPAPLSFPDGFPVLVCNTASLADLNRRLPAPIPMERFRPNIVLEGLPPWAEDRIDTLTFADLTLRLVKPCTRCVIPSRDHLSGEPAVNPLPVLKRFRFSRELLGVMFGENAVIARGVGAKLHRGESCQVAYDA